MGITAVEHTFTKKVFNTPEQALIAGFSSFRSHYKRNRDRKDAVRDGVASALGCPLDHRPGATLRVRDPEKSSTKSHLLTIHQLNAVLTAFGAPEMPVSAPLPSMEF